MEKQVLKTDETAIQRELNKIETSIEMFQPLLDAMIKNGYEPTLSEFRAIVRSRNERKSSYFDDFLRDKTVKKHPEIERLPITAFMKKTLIELPKECEEIERAYIMLPTTRDVIQDAFRIEFSGRKIVVSESALSEIKERHTIYSKPEQLAVYEKVNNALNVLKQLQAETGINIFRQGIVINATNGNLSSAEVNAHAILQMP
jgi:hypothetical protein